MWLGATKPDLIGFCLNKSFLPPKMSSSLLRLAKAKFFDLLEVILRVIMRNLQVFWKLWGQGLADLIEFIDWSVM